MVNHANSSAVENCSVAITPANPPDFWFDLRSLVHYSWLEKSYLKDILLLGDKKISTPAWNLLYRNICKETGIDCDFVIESHSDNKLEIELTQKLFADPLLPLAFVGACMRVQNNLDLIDFPKGSSDDNEEDECQATGTLVKYPVSKPIELSLPQKRAAFHAKNCFALDRRFRSLMMTDDILTGLCFLKIYLCKANSSLWHRLRLVYDKQMISCVEDHIEDETLNPASYRCLRRLFRFTSETVLPKV